MNSVSKPIKIAMVAACPFPANHGTPGAIRELALHLVKQGHEVHVVTYPQGDDLDIAGLHIHRVKVPFMKPGPVVIGPSFERLMCDIFLVPKLIQVIRKHHIDVIHAHNYEANIAGALARVFTRKPLIYNAVTTMADELPSYGAIKPDALARWLGKSLDHIVPRLSDLIMVLSDELKDELVALGNPEKKILIVPPGVELDWLSSGNRKRKRAELHLDEATTAIVYTGALEAFQRLDYLLEAMAIVADKCATARLFIIGNIRNESAREKLFTQIEQLGIEHCVTFIDEAPLSELPDFLAAADVAVVPRPNCPGYPIKLLNYMAASLPVVSFAGSAKSLCHGYSGFIAKNDQPSSLAEGMLLFTENPGLAATMGARARQSLEQVFDWPTLAKGIATTYWQLMQDRKKCPRIHLSEYFKQSYTPVLEERTARTELPLEGKLTYPALQHYS